MSRIKENPRRSHRPQLDSNDCMSGEFVGNLFLLFFPKVMVSRGKSSCCVGNIEGYRVLSERKSNRSKVGLKAYRIENKMEWTRGDR